jgi:hypothetical protein
MTATLIRLADGDRLAGVEVASEEAHLAVEGGDPPRELLLDRRGRRRGDEGSGGGGGQKQGGNHARMLSRPGEPEAR